MRGGWRIVLLACACLVIVASSPAAVVDSNSRPFLTGFLDDNLFNNTPALGMARLKDAGGTIVRLRLDWSRVAPSGSTKPPGFDATDPNSPFYDWSSFDRVVQEAVTQGIRPIADLLLAPTWALIKPAPDLSATVPDPTAFGEFALAAAKHYDGTTPGIPRVSDWEIWNEPNLGLGQHGQAVVPQFVHGQAYSPGWYRDFVNSAATAVKSVHPDNLVIAGSTAPFWDMSPDTVAGTPDAPWGPLTFMRKLFCLSDALTPVCDDPVRFDVWSHHPYTSGGPTAKATLPDDVTLGDIPKMQAVLAAAWANNQIVAPSSPPVWVDEFSWDSMPPDPNGVPTELLSRWISEACYQLWSEGVTVLTWFTLVDSDDFYQSGFYFKGASPDLDTPKATLPSFRFPFVAYPTRTGVRVWGRTPGGRATDVTVEQKLDDGWHELGVVTADQYGIFQARFDTSSLTRVRARTADLGETSVPFSLRLVPDQYFTPFGGAPLEPPRAYAPRPPIPPRRNP